MTELQVHTGATTFNSLIFLEDGGESSLKGTIFLPKGDARNLVPLSGKMRKCLLEIKNNKII